MRLILASRSPGRLRILRHAGLDPEVMVSGFDEHQVQDPVATSLAQRLAIAKGEAVLPRIDGDAIVVAGDSVLEFEGKAWGKPRDAEAVVQQWRRLRGRQGVLHSGHYVWVRDAKGARSMHRLASTELGFADLPDDEIRAYAATGEPLGVAGSFTIDGFGSAFVTHIVGDPHNVVGISPSLLRQMLTDLGIRWHQLWQLPRQ